jgi:BASS family bile acid:Na+ symporter
MSGPGTAEETSKRAGVRRSTQIYSLVSTVCLWVGFLLPFAISRFVGMAFGRHPLVTAANGLLWAAGLWLGYATYIENTPVATSQSAWIRLSNFVTRHPATIIMLAIASGFLYYPSVEKSFVASSTNYWLMGTLFFMGVQITPADWRNIARNPKTTSVAVLLHWFFMPAISYFLAHAILLKFISGPTATTLAVGIVIVGTTSTGAASNTLTLISRGDLALSVSVTTVNALLAPFLQPFLIRLFVGQAAAVDVRAIFVDLLEIVLIPVIAGTVLGARWPDAVGRLKPLLCALAVVLLALLMAGTISRGTFALLQHLAVLPILAIAVACQGLLGLSIGFYVPKLFGFSYEQRVAACFEVGVQNAALAAVVALDHFNPLAAIPAVLYGKLQNILAIAVFVPRFQKAIGGVEAETTGEKGKVVAAAESL